MTIELISRGMPPRPDLATRPVLVVAGCDDWSIPLRQHRRMAAHFAAPLEVCAGVRDRMLDPDREDSAAVVDRWLRTIVDRSSRARRRG